jgi:LCP family protein required for cell wall assembly
MKRQLLALILALTLMLFPITGLCQSGPKSEPNNCITILLLGVDQVEGVERNAAAIVIAALNLNTGALRLAAVDRNTLAKGPGGSEVKLCTTMALGGPALTLQSVCELYGLQVTRFVSVDLKGMETIIDALGGVDIDVKESEINILLADQKTKAFQKAGMQTLGGAQALVYMKDHTGEEKGSSHLSRVLAACMQKGIQMGFNPLIELVSELLAYVETNMTLMDMMDAAMSALSAPIKGMETKQFPVNRAEKADSSDTAVRIKDSAAESEALYAFLYGDTVIP